MAIAFVAAATGNAGGTASVTIGAPAGIAAGDLLVAGISTRGGSVVTPAGWTHVRTVASLSGHYSVTYVYVKLATVADVGASWQWALSSGTTWWAGTIAAYSGAARATLWVESAEYANNAQNLAITGTPGASGISGTRTIVVYSAAYSTAGTTPTITPASGTTRGAPSNDTVRNTLVDDTAAPSSARSAAVNVNSVTSSVTLVLAPRYSETPTAPTLTAPANGGFVSAGLTINLEGTFNDPDSGDVPSAYAARIKESGGAYQWVDAAGQMAAVETWVPHVSTALLAAIDALELAADTTYNWSLAAKDSLGNVSPYASDRTFTTQAPPDVLATGPATTQGTTRPTGTWSYASGGQTEWEAAFFTAAQVSAGGFDPDVAVPVTGSGVVAGSTEREWEAADDLGAGDYWFYIHVAENGVWSDWDAIAFAIELTPADPPDSMTVTPDPDTASVAVAVLTPHRVLADQLTARVAEVQRRIDGGVWEAVRDGEAAEFAAGVLADLNAVWLAEAYDPDVGQFLMDQSGNGHHLRLGSQWPAYVAKGALNLPGVVGNYASTPDSVANSVTGDIDIVVHAALTDWTPSALPVLVAKRSAAGESTTAFAFYLNPTSTLGLAFTAGATPVTATSTASLSVADGADKWLRVTRDATSGEVIFYSSDDGETWTPLGTAVASTAGLIPDTTADLQVGAQYTGGTDAPTNGRIFYAEVRNGIDGDPVAKFDPSAQADFATSWVASTGETWTVQRPGAVIRDGGLVLPGVTGSGASTPDLPVFAITGDLDVRVQVTPALWNPAGDQALASQYGAAGNRSWLFQLQGGAAAGTVRPHLYISTDGTAESLGAAAAFTAPANGTWLRVTRVSATGALTFWTSPDGVTWTNQATASTTAGVLFNSTAPVEIGGFSGGGNAFNGKVYRAQVYNGIDGTIVLDVDFTTADAYTSSFTCTTGQRVTLNGQTGADTNDPKFLAAEEDPYIYQAGTNNTLSTPDIAAYAFAGDTDFRFTFTPDHYSGAQGLIAHTDGGEVGWRLFLSGTSGLTFSLGAADHLSTATLASVGITPDTKVSVKVTRVAATGTISFWYSTDYNPATLVGTWTKLGADVAGATGAIPASGVTMRLFSTVSSGLDSHLFGKFYAAQLLDGINGTLVLDIDTSVAAAASTTFLATTGQTVTINRSATGRKAVVVDRDLFLFGTDDYMGCPDPLDGSLDVAAADPMTAFAIFRVWNAAQQQMVMVKRSSAAGPGWELYAANDGTRRFLVYDGVAFPSVGNAAAAGALRTLVGVRNQPTDTITAKADATATTVADTTTGTLANTQPLRIGAWSNQNAANADMELIAAGFVKRVLTDAETQALLYEVGGLYAAGGLYREAVVVDDEAPFHRDLEYRARIVEVRA